MWPCSLSNNEMGFSVLFHHWIFCFRKMFSLLKTVKFHLSICIHAVGSHTLLMCSWILLEKVEGRSILEVICLLYNKSQHFLRCLGVTLFLNILEWWIPYILFCEVREIERSHNLNLMIKIPSVETLHYNTFQNRKDELLLQWHSSNLKLESIALPALNTKDVHCLQTEFFLVCSKPMIRFFSV